MESRRWGSWRVGLGALAFFGARSASASVDPEPGWGLPRDVSLEGWRIDQLINVTNIFVSILFVIAVGWILIAALKHRNRTADYDHGNSKHSVVVACLISAAIFLVVDGNLFYNSVVDLNQAFWAWERIQGDNVVRIEVNARQWAWEARYAGPDKKFNTQDDVVTLNDIRVPQDTPIAIQLTSVDVIHSFYLPNLRVKTDAVPGTVNRLWFQVDQEKLRAAGSSSFDIACAQHCGTHHYKMKGVLTVHSQEDFNAWSQEASVYSSLDFDAGPDEEEKKQGITVDPKYQAHWGWKWREI